MHGTDPMDRPMNTGSSIAIGCGTFWTVGAVALFVGFAAFVVSKILEVRSKMSSPRWDNMPFPSGFPDRMGPGPTPVFPGMDGSSGIGSQGIRTPWSELGSFLAPALLIGVVVAVVITVAMRKR
jgi:hypothetical protein